VVLQGGTDLVVAIKQKGLRPSHVVSLALLRDSLAYVKQDDRRLRMGSMTTIATLIDLLSPTRGFEVLLDGLRTIGSYQIRNAATIGGNLCNASPAADSVPPLLVLGASLRIRGTEGERLIAIEEFFVGPGKTALLRGDILEEIIILAPPPHSGGAFVKLGRREGEDIAIASAAVYLELKGDIVEKARIALGSVAPTPIRARMAEKLLLGKFSESKAILVADCGSGECQPINDVRASEAFRRTATKVLIRSAIERALQRATGGTDS
jgi:CO/xanthine dehydrogenase FAD-binding subunit